MQIPPFPEDGAFFLIEIFIVRGIGEEKLASRRHSECRKEEAKSDKWTYQTKYTSRESFLTCGDQ